MDEGDSTLDDPRVLRAVQEYQAELEAGRRPRREEFLARHADVAPALQECLAGLELLHTAGGRLKSATTVQGPSSSHADLPEALGDFRIVRELGRGGMGIVYEAIQLSLGRRVALKVLPFAAALDRKQKQRFLHEAQAAAHLHHPNIVPVYAVGCERGVHYYAMQLIEGQNLASVIAARRGTLERQPGPPAPPDAETRRDAANHASTVQTDQPCERQRQAADWIAQAAQALDYAHDHGVVHRDIKPANLLLDGSGTVWVVDFGLAQFQTDTGLTQTGDLLGTLRYMSPEQAGGPRGLIDHRTDIYSLGVTLYELLTLHPPFDGTDRRTLLHQILHTEPLPPRHHDRSIPPDLETIVLKAIAKQPADRYATAGEFAADLRRFLRDEPIRARRITLAQRLSRWLRRHPGIVVSGAAALGLVAIGSTVSMILIGREQEKTRAALEQERQRAREADERLLLARRSVDDIVETAERELADLPHMQDLRRRLLEAALAHYQEFVKQRTDDPTMNVELAAARDRIKKILEDLAEIQEAGHLFVINDPDVLAELRAGDEQRQQLHDLNRLLADRREELFRDSRYLSAEEKRVRHLELSRLHETRLTQIFTADQLGRVRQIAIQSMGVWAFRDAGVVAALKLTREQQEKIRAIEADVLAMPFLDRGRPGPDRGYGGPGSPPSGAPRKGSASFGPNAVDRVLALLTPEQRTIWRDLTGSPFIRRKGPYRGAGWLFPGSVPPGRPLDPSGRPPDLSGRPSDPVGRPPDLPGRFPNPPGRPLEPPGRPPEPPGQHPEAPGRPPDHA